MTQTLSDSNAPYTLYKSDISYFSGKLEAYLRYKQINYVSQDINLKSFDLIAKNTGVKKMPAVQTANNQWLFDSTPMLQWFEKIYPQHSIMPSDPALRFLVLMVEDYGDEWLWRPAMWWRWVPKISSRAVGSVIGKEFVGRFLAPILGRYFSHRQKQEWLYNDGVTKQNEGDVRDMLFREFEFLEPLLEKQPFIFGSHPSAADFGYFASMFRHFGNDYTSVEVMRRQASNCHEWVARLWNAKPARLPKEQQWLWPEGDHWQPLLKRIANDYLPYLAQNAQAHEKGKKRFNHVGQTFTFNNTKTTHYRVYCLEQLQMQFKALNKADQDRLHELFAHTQGLDILSANTIDSGLQEAQTLPKQALNYKQSLKIRLVGQPRN